MCHQLYVPHPQFLFLNFTYHQLQCYYITDTITGFYTAQLVLHNLLTSANENDFFHQKRGVTSDCSVYRNNSV